MINILRQVKNADVDSSKCRFDDSIVLQYDPSIKGIFLGKNSKSYESIFVFYGFIFLFVECLFLENTILILDVLIFFIT